MTIAFYIIAGFTAVAFLGVGGLKIARPKPALAEIGLVWVEDFPESSVKLIGLAEVLGAIGLIVPAALGIVPVLSPIAGIALVILMAGAAAVHLRRKESWIAPVVIAVPTVIAVVLGFLTVV